MGFWLGPRVQGSRCYFCFFFHKKEDNNPLINRIFESKIDLSLKR